MFLYWVLVCEHVAQLFLVGVTLFLFVFVFFTLIVISLYLECACDWQGNLLCSLSEMSVPGGLSYMHFTPFLF